LGIQKPGCSTGFTFGEFGLSPTLATDDSARSDGLYAMRASPRPESKESIVADVTVAAIDEMESICPASRILAVGLVSGSS
jgi:hypothetical protein